MGNLPSLFCDFVRLPSLYQDKNGTNRIRMMLETWKHERRTRVGHRHIPELGPHGMLKFT